MEKQWDNQDIKMAERAELIHKEPAASSLIQQHKRPLRLALASAVVLALTACMPEGPREITPQQIELACQITAPLPPDKYDPFSPHGIRVEERLVRPPDPRSRQTQPINSNIILVDRNWVEHPITANPDFDDNYPQLSPDGKKVVFVRRGPLELIDEKRNIAAHKNTGMEGIYAIKTDGTGERRLTHTPPEVSEEFPTWSPDGKKVIFVRRSPRQAELLSMNNDGTDLRRLVQVTSPSSRQNESPSIFFPRYSPDGSKIAYRDWSSTYVVGADGGYSTLVSRGVSLESPQGVDIHFVWLPNNQQLVISRQYRLTATDLRDRKFIHNADGSAFVDLTPICPPANPMPS